MDEKNVIASALSDYELARAFSELVADRWDNWDLSPFMLYLVDTCAPTALPYLADQFDIEGVRGFGIAKDEGQQRDIIKKSIALHKFIGTPWAIREACRTVGFPVIVLEEGVAATPGGPSSPEDWARFRVLIEADTNRHITTAEAQKLRLFVEFYKNERSHLVELGFYQSMADQVTTPREELDIMYLSLTPNPVMLDGTGAAKKVAIHSNIEWNTDRRVFDWADETGGKLTLDFTGEAGHSELIVSSDYYTKPEQPPQRSFSPEYSEAYRFPDWTDNRTMEIIIYAANGKRIGVLTVTQRPGNNNAYSRAYSNAYNLFSHAPYIRVDVEGIWLPDDPDQAVQINIESNTDWRIE